MRRREIARPTPPLVQRDECAQSDRDQHDPENLTAPDLLTQQHECPDHCQRRLRNLRDD